MKKREYNREEPDKTCDMKERESDQKGRMCLYKLGV